MDSGNCLKPNIDEFFRKWLDSIDIEKRILEIRDYDEKYGDMFIEFSCPPYKEMSREEIRELGKSRPYSSFCKFPIVIQSGVI